MGFNSAFKGLNVFLNR